ncbi:site-2 protease family protein [Planctomycetota bacterium]|nr:site-2 protease family protein [Planctomycetota bacterium]
MSFLALGGHSIDGTSAILWLMAWFITIGIHEGAHGWTAYKLGDDTAYNMGQRSFNPIRHIRFEDRKSVLFTVVFPVIGVLLPGGLPFGLAWVMVNKHNFKNPDRDDAIVSIAGPVGNLVGSILGFVLLAIGVYIVYSGGYGIQLSAFEFLRSSTIGADLLTNFGLRFMVLNVLLMVINLLPVPGVDGGFVMYLFLNPNGKRIFKQIQPYGLIIFFLLFMTVLSGPMNALISFAAADIPDWLLDGIYGK